MSIFHLEVYMYCNINHGQGCQRDHCRQKSYYSKGDDAYCVASPNKVSIWDAKIGYWEPLDSVQGEWILLEYILDVK
jgi:hypothetical protein